MKQFIVLCSMILLGVFLFELIAGEGPSLYETVRGVWQNEIAIRSALP